MVSGLAEEMEILRDKWLVVEMGVESAAGMVAKTDDLMAAVMVSNQVYSRGILGV